MVTPLDLEGLDIWLVERGMRGLPLAEQVTGYCQRIYEAGFPLKRTQMGMDTLHPRYGSHTFVWRPGDPAAEHRSHERVIQSREVYLRSPVYYMRSRGVLALRRRLDSGAADEFLIFPELRSQGLTDYAARMVPYNSEQSEGVAIETPPAGDAPASGQMLPGIFFSCATDRPEGFDDGHLDQVFRTLPYLALAMKSRLTYDVACTVIETYLGKDAGHRVLTGEIERGSAEAIRAVIWFCDLRGFTGLSDTLARDRLIALLNDYLDAMARPVHDHGGQILKFMGDGFLATFELSAADGQAVCRRALTAAAELRRSLAAFNEARGAGGEPALDFGLALHVGDVFYGNIGASDRLDFTVVGPAVNEASRIQDLCRPLGRDVLISRAFHDLIGGAPGELDSLGRHALRGVRAPQELFTLAAGS